MSRESEWKTSNSAYGNFYVSRCNIKNTNQQELQCCKEFIIKDNNLEKEYNEVKTQIECLKQQNKIDHPQVVKQTLPLLTSYINRDNDHFLRNIRNKNYGKKTIEGHDERLRHCKIFRRRKPSNLECPRICNPRYGSKKTSNSYIKRNSAKGLNEFCTSNDKKKINDFEPKYFKEDTFLYDRIYTPSKCQNLLLPPIQSMPQCQLSSNAFYNNVKTLDFDFCCTCNISKGEIFQFPKSKNQMCYESKNQKCLELKNQMCLDPKISKICLEPCKFIPSYINEGNQNNDMLNSQGTQTLSSFNKEKTNMPFCRESSCLFDINNNNYEVADNMNKDIINESNVPCQSSVTLKEDNDELYNIFDNESCDGIDYYINEDEHGKHNKHINVQCKPNELKIIPKQTLNNNSKTNHKETTNRHSSSNLNFEDENNLNKGIKLIEIESNKHRSYLNGGKKDSRELCFEVNVDAQLKKNPSNYNFPSNNVSTNESKNSQVAQNDNFRKKDISTKEILVSKPFFEIKSKSQPKEVDDDSILNTNIKSIEKNSNERNQDIKKYLKEIPRILNKKKFYIAKKNDFEDDFCFKEVSSLSNGYKKQIEIDCECKIVNAPQLQIDAICNCNVIGKPEIEVKQNCICHNMKPPQLQANIDHNGKELNINRYFNCTNQTKKCPKDTSLNNDANTSQSQKNINHNYNTSNDCSNFNYTNQKPLNLDPKLNLLHYQSAKCANETVPKVKNVIKDPLQNPMDPLLSPIDPLCLNLCYTRDSGR